jgi:uncharacterized LabA/DUF88 family protein
MVFIDAPNLLASARTLGVPWLKFEELVTLLCGGQKPVGCYCFVMEDPKRQAFYGQLERLGLHCERVSSGKSVDGRLIFHMLVNAIDNQYDIATLCAGDRDYIQVVERVKRMNKSVWVAAFSHSVNFGLRQMADRFISLDEVLDRIKMDPVFEQQ